MTKKDQELLKQAKKTQAKLYALMFDMNVDMSHLDLSGKEINYCEEEK